MLSGLAVAVLMVVGAWAANRFFSQKAQSAILWSAVVGILIVIAVYNIGGK